MSAFRVFVAWPDRIEVAEAAPGVEEAFDIMVADHVPAEHAAKLAVAAAKDGHDPVAWARHFIEVRQSV